LRRGTRPWLKGGATGRPAPAACLVIIALSHAPAFAQDELEEILVTGTRVAQRDFESASPIVSVSQEFFARTGSSTVETALNTLPQFVPAYSRYVIDLNRPRDNASSRSSASSGW